MTFPALEVLQFVLNPQTPFLEINLTHTLHIKALHITHVTQYLLVYISCLSSKADNAYILQSQTLRAQGNSLLASNVSKRHRDDITVLQTDKTVLRNGVQIKSQCPTRNS